MASPKMIRQDSVTHLERAELYVEQFATFDIITTIEPADGTG